MADAIFWCMRNDGEFFDQLLRQRLGCRGGACALPCHAAGFLKHRGVAPAAGIERDLFEALRTFPPLGLIVNETMGSAQPVAELGERIFPDTPEIADSAVTALLAIGSVAREQPDASGPLPCRVHNFYRGLPGLWVCMDPDCSELAEEDRNGICGRMYGQPHEVCRCGSRVLEFFTCRSCGSGFCFAACVIGLAYRLSASR